MTVLHNNEDKYIKAAASKCLNKEEITKVFDGKLSARTTLNTNKLTSHKDFDKDDPSIKHKALLAREHAGKMAGKIHLKCVNNVHSQLRTFLRQFNAVSTNFQKTILAVMPAKMI